MTRSVDDLAADLRPGLVGGCAYECGCDDPGNPQKCVHAGRFAALSELVALVGTLTQERDELEADRDSWVDQCARAIEQRDAWQRHARTSDTEVANLRLALATIMGAIDLDPVEPQLLPVDGANLVLRRIGVIVGEAERLTQELQNAQGERDAYWGLHEVAAEWEKRAEAAETSLADMRRALELIAGTSETMAWIPPSSRAAQSIARRALAAAGPAPEEGE